MHDYFCGWYFKCQSDTQTLAIIPAIHKSGRNTSCSIQFITDDGAWNIPVLYEAFENSAGFTSWKKPASGKKPGFRIIVGENCFRDDGIELNLHTPEFTATGSVAFGPLSPIRYDIMGPFRYVPFMECRHSVLSMRHSVNGVVCINGTDYKFEDALGYIEGDRGYSFPKEYAWTQCIFDGGSLILSVADIPFGAFHFTGIIGVIYRQGKEYRLATYLGAKVVKIGDGEVVVRQGDYTFTAKLLEKHAHPLFAPVGGAMSRTIHESASCRAAYSFRKNGQTLFEFETAKASFEYEYPLQAYPR